MATSARIDITVDSSAGQASWDRFGWRLTEQWIALSYSRSWWRLVYAATPTYRFQREGGVEPLPIEAEACDAAVGLMVEAGVLVR